MIDLMPAAKPATNVAAYAHLPLTEGTRTMTPNRPSVQGTSVSAAAGNATFVDTRAWSPPV